MKSNIQKRKYEKCNRLKRFECDQSDISDGATCVVSAFFLECRKAALKKLRFYLSSQRENNSTGGLPRDVL